MHATVGRTESFHQCFPSFWESVRLKDASAELKRSIGTATDSVKSYVDDMYDAVLAHTAGAEQSDDLTMLVLKYKGPVLC